MKVMPLSHWVDSCRKAAAECAEVSRMTVPECLDHFKKDRRFTKWAKDVIGYARTKSELCGPRGYFVMNMGNRKRMVGILRGGPDGFTTCVIR